MKRTSFVALFAAAWLLGCAAQAPNAEGGHSAHHHAARGAPKGIDAELAEVARIHGAAGPWAVAGYRMGRHALKKLGLEPQSFDLKVTHHSPREVQFSCIADGAAAATGASLGKLNLRLDETDEANVSTTYERPSTGAKINLRPTAAFRARFRDIPRKDLLSAGKVVMSLPDEEIFEQTP